MRPFLQLTVAYLIILFLLFGGLQFNAVDRGSATIKNFFFITGMHISNLKTSLAKTDVEHKESQKDELQNFDEPKYPLKNVIKKIGGRNILIPNSSQIFDGSWIRLNPTDITINSAGMRDYEYSYKKPANVCRIAIIGDSYTFGWGVELNESYTKVLEHELNSGNKSAYQVLNFGIPGYGLPEEIPHLQQSVVKFNPDVVIFASMRDDLRNWTRYGEILNDLMRTFDENYPEHRGKNLSDFRKMQILVPKIHSMINKEETEQFYKSSEGQELAEKYFAIVQDAKMAQNFSVIITILIAIEKYKIVLENIANKYNWTFIDASEIFDQTKYEITKVRLKPPVDGHPTPYAHRLIANKLYNEVNWVELCAEAFNETTPISQRNSNS